MITPFLKVRGGDRGKENAHLDLNALGTTPISERELKEKRVYLPFRQQTNGQTTFMNEEFSDIVLAHATHPDTAKLIVRDKRLRVDMARGRNTVMMAVMHTKQKQYLHGLHFRGTRLAWFFIDLETLVLNNSEVFDLREAGISWG